MRDGLSMSIGLRRVGNDTKMTCDFFQTFNMQCTLAVIHPPNFQVLFLVRFFSVFFLCIQYHQTKLPELIHMIELL